jgi:hypothetical protein
MQHLKYLVGILAFAAAAASAQPHGGRGGPRPPDMERLTVLLDLDTYQQGQVKRILEEQRATRNAARNAAQAESGERPSGEEMQARRVQSQQDLLTELQSVLTELHITKFTVLTERPARWGGSRFGPPVAE